MIRCPNCKQTLNLEDAVAGAAVVCGCLREYVVVPYPAIVRRPDEVRRSERIFSETDASCFYHPESQAEHVCDACGRFLCPVCSAEVGTETLCLQCLLNRTTKEDSSSLQRSFNLYDNIALAWATLPLLVFWMFGMFTAPIALYYAIRYFNQYKKAPIPRSPIRSILAIIFAVIGLVGSIAFWGMVILDAN